LENRGGYQIAIAGGLGDLCMISNRIPMHSNPSIKKETSIHSPRAVKVGATVVLRELL